MNVPTAKITERELPQPKFKKAPRITGVDFYNKYYKKLQEAHAPQHSDILLSQRIDEGITKDYRKDGIVAANKNGRFSTRWINPLTGQEFKSHWTARKNTPKGVNIVRFKDARGQLSVLSSAIDSYDYYPDVRKLLLRYTSNPEKDYLFENITQRRKNDLDEAASKGRFVLNVLRKYNRAAGY